MTEATVITLAREFFQVSLLVAGPVLAVAVVTGVLVSVAQVVTSVQDVTLAYVVRLAAVGAVLVVLGRWMLHALADYTVDLWLAIPALIG